VGNKVVSAHSFDSGLLCFWKTTEEICFDLGLDVTAKVSLGRKKMLGPMRDTLGRGDAEGKICFVANFLWRARRCYGKVPSLVEGVNGWLNHSSESLRKRIFEPRRIERMSVQPTDCVCHRRIVGCMDNVFVVVTAAASISYAQSDLLKSLEIRVYFLVVHVI